MPGVDQRGPDQPASTTVADREAETGADRQPVEPASETGPEAGPETGTNTPRQRTAAEQRLRLALNTWLGDLRDPRRRSGRLPGLVAALGVLLAAGLLFSLSGGMWFWADDWDYLLHRGIVDGVDRGLFEAHAGHWSTGPVLIVRALFEVFGMTYFWPYVAVTILIHLANGSLTYLVLRRASARPWAAVLGAWFVLFLGAGADNMLWDAAINNGGSILFGLLAIHLLQRRGFDRRLRRVVLPVWALLLASLMMSGTGIAAVAFVCVLATLSGGLRTGLTLVSVPAVSFVLWFFLLAGESSTSWARTGADMFALPVFVWTGLLNSFGTAVGVSTAGPIVFFAALGVTLLDRTLHPAHRNLAVAGLLGAVLQLLIVGVARLVFGTDIAATGRYAYLTLLFLTPLLATIPSAVAARSQAAPGLLAVLTAVLLAGYTVQGYAGMRRFHDGQVEVSQDWKGRLLAMVAISDQGVTPISASNDDLNREADPLLVSSPAIREALPSGRPRAQDFVDVGTMYYSGVSEKSYGFTSPTRVSLRDGFDPEVLPAGRRCLQRRAFGDDAVMSLPTVDGTEITVDSPSSEVRIVLERGSASSQPRVWGLPKGRVHIASALPSATMVLTFNEPGLYTICTG